MFRTSKDLTFPIHPRAWVYIAINNEFLHAKHGDFGKFITRYVQNIPYVLIKSKGTFLVLGVSTISPNKMYTCQP